MAKKNGKKKNGKKKSAKNTTMKDAQKTNTGKTPCQGKLTKANFGYSLPLDQPLYQPPPVEYRDSTILTYNYETDPEAAAAVLPAQLSLTETPTAKMVFANYQWSSVGFYNEVVQAIECTYQGKTYVYPIRLHVTSDRAMASGREIGGFPKKMGHIEFSSGAEYSSHLESPKGMRVCSGMMVPKACLAVLPQEPKSPIKYVSLRVMPNPVDPANPSVCELLESVWELGPGEMWSGIGSFHFDCESELDPYHKLPVVGPVNCAIYRGSMVASSIELLERF